MVRDNPTEGYLEIDWLFSLEFMDGIWKATFSFCCGGMYFYE